MKLMSSIKRLWGSRRRGEDRAGATGASPDEELLAHSPYFDKIYYLETNPDVARAGVSPIAHFLASGAREGRNPSPSFDTTFYVDHYPDVAVSGMNPLMHFLRHGRHEGRITTRPPSVSTSRIDHTEDAIADWRRRNGTRPGVTETLFGCADGRPCEEVVHVFSSITSSYLPKARVLAKSVKRQHPNWPFIIVLVDDPPPDLCLEREPFDRILMPAELGISDWKSWAFRHRVVEICTACKGPAAWQLFEQGVDKLIYLDPDTAVMNSLRPLAELLDRHPVILTPHLLTAEPDLDAIRDNEINILKHGVYNLGFFAVRNQGQGRDFVSWWRTRLEHHCYVDYANGLFTDQRWCDLAPALFDRLLILRDPGYNVASWNIAHRPLAIDPVAGITARGAPLRFYHFTGYDSGLGVDALRRLCAPDSSVWALWEWYAGALQRNGQQEEGRMPWRLATFDDGRLITDEMRLLYRVRQDIQQVYPDPYSTSGADGGYARWWDDYGPGRAVRKGGSATSAGR